MPPVRKALVRTALREDAEKVVSPGEQSGLTIPKTGRSRDIRTLAQASDATF